MSMKQTMCEFVHGMKCDEVCKFLGEIVRCRDCRHFTPKGTHKFENGKTNADFCEYVRGWMLQITPDGYCKWGERREDD